MIATHEPAAPPVQVIGWPDERLTVALAAELLQVIGLVKLTVAVKAAHVRSAPAFERKRPAASGKEPSRRLLEVIVASHRSGREADCSGRPRDADGARVERRRGDCGSSSALVLADHASARRNRLAGRAIDRTGFALKARPGEIIGLARVNRMGYVDNPGLNRALAVQRLIRVAVHSGDRVDQAPPPVAIGSVTVLLTMLPLTATTDTAQPTRTPLGIVTLIWFSPGYLELPA